MLGSATKNVDSPEDEVKISAECRICGCKSVAAFVAREMMYGWREPFDYLECSACHCVQIASYPPEIARYYPSDYYAYADQHSPTEGSRRPPWKDRVRAGLMRVPALRRQWLALQSTREWLTERPLVRLYVEQLHNPEARILDVGCGDGVLLRDLRTAGYRNAEGVDPFIAADISYRGRRLVRKAWLSDLDGRYDCVSLHHSLEHMPNQSAVLGAVRRLLAPAGLVFIRIPVVGGEAWHRYRENWVQLDPPRHYYLHSEQSLRLLAERCGLAIRSISYDSTAFQFWGSELYVRDIPLRDPRAPGRDNREIFPPADLAEWERQAVGLNAAGRGDQIVAILGVPR